VESLGRAEQLLLEDLLLDVDRRHRLLVERRGPWVRALLDALRPGEHEALARARHRQVKQPAHLGLVGLASVRAGVRPLQELPRHRVRLGARRTRHLRGGQAEHEDVVELESPRSAHAHDLDRRRGRRAGGLLLAQPGLRHGREVAREVARGRVRLAPHVGRGELGQLRDVAQSLSGVRVRGEHLLAA
jgi:hypothetical protein